MSDTSNTPDQAASPAPETEALPNESVAQDMTELLAKHADFHQSAGSVARKINAGQYADAENLIGSGSHFADISLEVTTLLSTAKRQF